MSTDALKLLTMGGGFQNAKEYLPGIGNRGYPVQKTAGCKQKRFHESYSGDKC